LAQVGQRGVVSQQVGATELLSANVRRD
jgi:hypothetical protein